MGDELEEHKKDQEKVKKEILLEKFKIAAEIQDRYNNLFWYRTTVFFGINTALFAGYGLVATKILELEPVTIQADLITGILMLFGVFGAYLSKVWLQIHKRATFLQNYYRFRAGVIEQKLNTEPEIFAKSYRIAALTKSMATKEELEQIWKDLYKNEWEEKRNQWNEDFKELNGKEWDIAKSEDPGSLRGNLDRVYSVFKYVWIILSILGGVILLTILTTLL
jgi:hypothetical protein